MQARAIKALIVDDNQDLCQLLSEILEEAGYNVGTACDGRAALEKIKKERHDIMILDYKLSGISGLTILKKTRQIRPSIRTIMISAYGNESVRKRAQKLEAYAFIDKPFNIEGLVKVVNKALKRNKFLRFPPQYVADPPIFVAGTAPHPYKSGI